MNKFKDYTKLDVWIKSREIVNKVYKISSHFPKEEVFGLTSQIRRCSVSVPSNIAEGIGRQHLKEKIQFLHISRGSLYELETQLYLSFDLNYIKDEKLSEMLLMVKDCKKLINGFIRYFKQQLNSRQY